MNAKEALGPWLKRYWGLEIVMSDSHTVTLSDAQSKALWSAFNDALEFIEDQEDVVDGPDGEQCANRAMQLAQRMRYVLAIAKGKAP